MSQFTTPTMGAASPFIGINPSGVDPNAAIEQIGTQQRSYLQRRHEQAMLEAQQRFNASQNDADRLQQVSLVEKQMAFSEKMADRERKDRLFYEKRSEDLAFEQRRLDDRIAELRSQKSVELAENAATNAGKIDAEINTLKEQKKKLERQYQHLAVLQQAREGLFSTENVSEEGVSLGSQLFKTLQSQITSDQARATAFTASLTNAVKGQVSNDPTMPTSFSGQSPEVAAVNTVVDKIADFVGVESGSDTKAKLASMLNIVADSSMKTGAERDADRRMAAQLWNEIVAAGVSEKDLVRAVKMGADVLQNDSGAKADLVGAQAEAANREGGGPDLKKDVIEQGKKQAGVFDRVANALTDIQTLNSVEGKPLSRLWDEAERDQAGEMEESIINIVMAISKTDNLEDLVQALDDADGTTQNLRKQGEVQLAMMFEDFHPEFRKAVMDRVEQQLRMFNKSSTVSGARKSLTEYGYEGGYQSGALTELEKAQDDLDATLENLTNEYGSAGAQGAVDIEKRYAGLEGQARGETTSRMNSLRNAGSDRGTR